MIVSVSGSVLKSYRVNRNIDIGRLAKRLKLAENQINIYENGQQEIEHTVLEKLASIYKVSWFAFLDDKTEEPIDHGHDNRSTNNQREKLDAETIELLDDVAYLLDVANEVQPEAGFEISGYRATIDNPELSAARLRTHLKVDSRVVRDLKDDYAVLRYWKDLFSDTGLYVLERSWTTHSVRAFSLVRGNKAAVVLSTKDRPLARVFSLLHEIYHVINNQPGLCDFHLGRAQDTEVLCNQFAASFLMPGGEFTEYAEALGLDKNNKNSVTDSDVSMLRNYFRTSRLSIYRRLLTCSFITKEFYETVQGEYEDMMKEPKPRKGGDFYRNKVNQIGKRLAVDLMSAYANERISVRTLAQVMGVRVTQLPVITNLVGGDGKRP